MNSLHPLAIVIGLHSLLFQEVEGFADVILPEEHIGELFEDILRIRPLGRGKRFLPPKIAITDHDQVPERQSIFMIQDTMDKATDQADGRCWQFFV
jgi:hypothetical protein